MSTTTPARTPTHIYPAIMADDVAATRDFYVDILGFGVIFDSGWYVQLEANDDPKTQIAVVLRDHHTVPDGHRNRAAGVLISVELPDVDAVYAEAKAAGLVIALDMRDEEFGQRHFITVDPAGTLVDIMTLIPATDEYRALGRTD